MYRVLAKYFNEPNKLTRLLTRYNPGYKKKNGQFRMKQDSLIDDLGIFTPKRTPTQKLEAGDVGYVVAGIKQARESQIYWKR